MTLEDQKKYLEMQLGQMNSEAGEWQLHSRDRVVGSYNAHNNMREYDDILFKDFDTKGKVALEYGCGPGRNIIRFKDRFDRIDGVDISDIVIEKAKMNLEDVGVTIPNLKVCDGRSIPFDDSAYDVVFSVICLQHICVHEIRYNIMCEIYRVLKPGGYFCAQMGFGPGHGAAVGYSENKYDASGTNGQFDTRVDDSNDLKDDLYRIGFSNFKFDLSPHGPGDIHEQWIWFQVEK